MLLYAVFIFANESVLEFELFNIAKSAKPDAPKPDPPPNTGP